MKRGWLSQYFEGVVVKVLSMVETTPSGSNQHEFNSSAALKRLLGENDRKGISARYIWLGQEQEAISAEGWITWYDSRRRHPTRSEYRLYYPGNEVTELMQPGDVFFLAMTRHDAALVIVAPAESTIQNQLMWLFGLDVRPELQFTFRDIGEGNDAQLDFAARYILDEIGIEPEEPEADFLDSLIEPFGTSFPATRIFSRIARDSLPDVSPREDPDAAVVAWMEREEQLFRRLERRIVTERISAGFSSSDGADVDGFLQFSLSVQNRRKARAGQALENHLEAIFNASDVRYARGALTENRNRPDFLFPGQPEYQDSSFPAQRLTMLGAKSTLKDRWRQVLSEAVRIKEKHLLTLEPGISRNQTDEMAAKQLQLVVPATLQETYQKEQRGWLMSLEAFLALVRERQDNLGTA